MTTATGEDWNTLYARMCAIARREAGAWFAANLDLLAFGSVDISNSGRVTITVYADGEYGCGNAADLIARLDADAEIVDVTDRRHWSATAGDVKVLIVEWLR